MPTTPTPTDDITAIISALEKLRARVDAQANISEQDELRKRVEALRKRLCDIEEARAAVEASRDEALERAEDFKRRLGEAAWGAVLAERERDELRKRAERAEVERDAACSDVRQRMVRIHRDLLRLARAVAACDDSMTELAWDVLDAALDKIIADEVKP